MSSQNHYQTIVIGVGSMGSPACYFLARRFPRTADDILYTKNCLYTYSPDQHFIIDKLPGFDDRVIIACGFSGHAFKLVPVIGEVLADLATRGTTDLPIDFRGLSRFS